MRTFARNAGASIKVPAGGVVPNFSTYIMGLLARRIRGMSKAI